MNYIKILLFTSLGFGDFSQRIINDSTLAFAATISDIYATKSIGSFCIFSGELNIKADTSTSTEIQNKTQGYNI
jgi:hypothetical protein